MKGHLWGNGFGYVASCNGRVRVYACGVRLSKAMGGGDLRIYGLTLLPTPGSPHEAVMAAMKRSTSASLTASSTSSGPDGLAVFASGMMPHTSSRTFITCKARPSPPAKTPENNDQCQRELKIQAIQRHRLTDTRRTYGDRQTDPHTSTKGARV